MVGNDFMFALDRLTALPAAPSLADLYGGEPAAGAQLLACEISFGRRHAADAWEILHSTVPEREGRSLFAVHGALRRRDALRYEQVAPDGVRRIWRQVERGPRFTDLRG